jgi:hypothetical protein
MRSNPGDFKSVPTSVVPLKPAARRTHRTADAAEVVIDAVERTEMDARHAALDDRL